MANRALGGVSAYQLKYGVDPKTEYTLSFANLYGGLNLRDLDYLLNSNESPDMMNLNWNNGILSSRAGQRWADTSTGTGVTCSSERYYGMVFLVRDNTIWYCDPTGDSVVLTSIYMLPTGTARGTFVRYQDVLLYKAPGVYLQIEYNGTTFTCAPVEAYTPIIQINTDPTTHAGDRYQSENRISSKKEIWYNATSGVTNYVLPVTGATVESVYVDDALTTAYTVSEQAAGTTVVFNTAPPVTSPATNNTVRIIYSKSNTDAYNSVMSCPYAEVYGGNDGICVVVGGCEAQPNAYFWSNNDDVSMNAGYFPTTNYNLAGGNSEPITGFGKQQGMLVVFKTNSVGKAEYGTTDIDDKTYITMNYTNINSRIGCDLPWSIQLVENNLVFCNTEQGVHIVLNSSSALENNIVCISEKINGSGSNGLLRAVRRAKSVCSVDSEAKYLLTIITPDDDVTFEWDYTISSYSSPSWFRHNNIKAIAYFHDVGEVGYLSEKAQVVMFAKQTFIDCDFDSAETGAYKGIDKYYQFPTMFYDTYDRLKNVNSIVFSIRGDTNTRVRISYSCDYMDRDDPTDMLSYGWSLVPRDLSAWSLAIFRQARVFRRKPCFKHIRHFTIRLENDISGHDLSLVSAQIFYNYQGRQR